MKSYPAILSALALLCITSSILYMADYYSSMKNYASSANFSTPALLSKLGKSTSKPTEENSSINTKKETTQDAKTSDISDTIETHQENDSAEPYLIATSGVLNLGGKNLNHGTVTIQMSDGSNFSPLILEYTPAEVISLTTNPSPYADTENLPVTATSRNIYVWAAYPTTSGSMTVNMRTQYGDQRGSFVIRWSPVTTFEAYNTGVQRTDNGSTITYTFGFSITPHEYFGNPTISLVIYNYGVCINDTRKTFKYDNINRFNVSCTVEKGKDYKNERLEVSLESVEREDGYGILSSGGDGGGYLYILDEDYDQ